MTSDTPDLEATLRRACSDLDTRLRRGETARAEEVFERHPELTRNVESAVEVIYAEFVAREELGPKPDAGEYARRFPQWKEAIGRQLDVHAAVEVPSGPIVGMLSGGDRLGEYELIERVASGGVGVVYKARHVRLGHIAAIKVLLAGAHATPEQLERFENEARALANLGHPNVVHLYEMARPQDGLPYLAIEWIEGGSLADRVALSLPSSESAARLLSTVARTVHDCHAKGFLHGDLKPANILLAPGDLPKVADFGFARSLSAEGSARQSAVLRATPCYAAPEQLNGSATLGPAADVYALGAVLYELLTGRPPFLAESPMETIRIALSEEPAPPRRLRPDVPRDLETICLRCLEKDARRRYASAGDLADDLDRFLKGEPIRARPVPPAERLWKWARRRPAAAALAALAIVGPPALLAVGVDYVVTLRAARADAENRVRELRRSAYALQIAQAVALWERDPGRAGELLRDAERCPPELREFSWRLLDRLCHAESALWKDDGTPILAMAWSPDGRFVASCGTSGVLRIRAAETGKEIATRPPEGFVRLSLAFTPDSRRLAFGTGRGRNSIFILDPETGRTETILEGHEGEVVALAFSPNGKRLASSGEDGTIRFWDTETWSSRKVIQGHEGVAKFLSWSPDGQRLAGSPVESRAVVWDIEKGSVEQTVGVRNVSAIRYSPDGGRLAVGTTLSMLEIRDARTLELRQAIPTPHVRLTSLEFSPDGKVVATTGMDHALRLWDAEGGRELAALRGHTELLSKISFSPDGGRVATSSHDGTIRLWDWKRRNPAILRPGIPKLAAAAVSPDGRTLALAGYAQVRVWDLATRTERWKQLRAHAGGANAVAVTPDGSFVLSSGEDATLKVWGLSDGKLVRSVPAIKQLLAVSADSVAAALDDSGKLKLLNVATGESIAAPAAGDALSAAFGPGGGWMAFGLGSNQLVVWRRGADGAWREDRRLSVEAPVTSLAISAETCAAALKKDNLVLLWETKSWTPLAPLRRNAGYGLKACFSPDGRTIVAAGRHPWNRKHGEAKVWGVATGRELMDLPGTAIPVLFLPDGNTLVTSNEDHDILLWEASPISSEKRDRR
jgi:eukaryotic-like serine/threonine-protein kinase